jgi:hypothetical protein
MTCKRKKVAAKCRTPAITMPPGAQRGMALVLVLWLVVLLSVLVSGHARNVHTETGLVSRQIEAAQARALAEAGAQRAILDLMSGAARQWPANGTVNSFKFDGQDIFIAIRDATGLIDLNSASSELLNVLISTAVPDQATRQRIVDAILDWRDRDSLTHLYGAEDDDYRSAGLTWSAERSSVDLEYASPFLISALTGREIEAVQDRAAPRKQVNNQSRSGTFHIYVSASVGDTTNFSLETVVRLFSDPEHPFAVLHWREPARTPLPTSERHRT